MMSSSSRSELEQFSIEVVPDRDVVRVRPSGELDLATAGELEARLHELLEAGFRRMEIDLRRLRFIDSSGLRVILRLDEAARRDGLELTLRRGPHAVQRMFEVSGTADLLRFESA